MLGAVVRLMFVQPSDGGRVPPTRFDGGLYRPHFRVGANGEYLGVAFVAGPAKATAGKDFEATVALIYDGVDYSGLQAGVQFAVLEGPRTVATGTVVSRFENDSDWRETLSSSD